MWLIFFMHWCSGHLKFNHQLFYLLKRTLCTLFKISDAYFGMWTISWWLQGYTRFAIIPMFMLSDPQPQTLLSCPVFLHFTVLFFPHLSCLFVDCWVFFYWADTEREIWSRQRSPWWHSERCSICLKFRVVTFSMVTLYRWNGTKVLPCKLFQSRWPPSETKIKQIADSFYQVSNLFNG